jgi:hypothetical protein
MTFSTDKELFKIAKEELFTALVGDVLDKLGYMHQFLPQLIKPIRADMVVIGRAMTVLEADVFEESSTDSSNPLMKKPFGSMLKRWIVCKKMRYIFAQEHPPVMHFGVA